MTFIINISKIILNFIYTLMKMLPVKKKILFLSRQSNNPSMDIEKLNKEILKKHPDYKTVILCRKLEGNIFQKIRYCLHMIRQLWHLATSQVVILDSYAILVSLLNHRKRLLVIQMWHSVGTMKKFAYSILDKPEGTSSKLATAMRMHANYDWILCAGEGYRSHLADGFNYPEDKIKIYPLPRVEILQDAEYKTQIQNKIYNQFPELKTKKNILYVPTFRKNDDEKQAFIQAVNNLKRDFQKYNYDFNLILKTHPLSGYSSPYSEFSSFDMLFIADYIISDYSCIIYEGAILQIPLFFYTYDYDSYMSKRDVYINYKQEIPNKLYADPSELFDAIANNQFDMNAQNAFLSKYVDYDKKHITEDIVDFVWDHLKS